MREAKKESFNIFQYKGLSKSGDEEFKGIIVAPNKEKVNDILVRRNIFPIKITKKSSFIRQLMKVNPTEIALLFDGLAQMLKAGLGILAAIENLINEQFSPKITIFLYQLKVNIEDGMGLTDAIEKIDFFPIDVVEMIRVGNESGKIIEVFGNLKEFYQQKEKINKAVFSAVAYPIGIILVALAILLLLVPKMVNPMKGIYRKFEGVEFPLATELILAFVDGLAGIMIYLVIAGVTIVYLLMRQYKNNIGFKAKFDLMLLNMPIFGEFIKKLSHYKFLMALEILYNAGIPIVDAFTMIAKSQGNYILQKDFYRMRDALKEGQKLSPIVRKSKFIPDMTKSLISIGEETGRLAQQLNQLTLFAKKSFDAYTGFIQGLMSPIATIVVGGLIGTVVVAVYLPILSMMDMLNQ